MHLSVISLLALGTCALALPSSSHGAAHHGPELARRVLSSHNETSSLSKRFGGTRWTFFTPGLGACGKTNGDSDFIVALNIEQWDGGSHCFEQISMSFGGKTTTATIVDQCPGCPYGGLDLSPGLFGFFGSLDLGVLSGTWTFGSGGGSNNGGGNDNPKPKTSSAPPPPPPPKTTQHTNKQAATSDEQPKPSSTEPPATKTSAAQTHTSSTSASTKSTTPSSSAAPTPTPSPAPTSDLYTASTNDPNANGTLAQVYLALAQLGGLVEKA